MKIGIDISQIAHEGTGVARYISYLIEALLHDTSSDHEYIFFYSSLRKDLPRKIKQEIMASNSLVQVRIPPTLVEILWNRIHIVPIETFIGDVDLFISSDWVEPPARKARKITMVHDLIVYKFPETTSTQTMIDLKNVTISPNILKIQKQRLSWVQKESQIVVTDSLASKRDIVEILSVPEEKVSVLYPCVQTPKVREEDRESVRRKYQITKPFILAVGKLEPRKNIANLIKAFIQSDCNNLELKIVGPNGWGTELDFSLPPSVHFMGYLPDKELYALYTLAEAFVFPSLYEGFGYPIIEAMSLGCPVATSNVSSMKELAENVGLLFDPYSIDEISEAIKKLHNSSSLRKKVSAQGLLRARDFSMPGYRQSLLKIIKDAAK